MRSLPKYSATTVQHAGRQALFSVFAEHVCDFPTKNRTLNKDRFDVLSIPNSVIKKRPSRKHRGKKCVTQRFLNSPRYRTSQTAVDGREDFRARYDAIAAENHLLCRDTGRAEQK